jgi:hypothetical protein
VAPDAKRARKEGALEELTLTELYKKVEEEELSEQIDELLMDRDIPRYNLEERGRELQRLAIIEFFRQRSAKKASSSKEPAEEPVKEPVEEQAEHLGKEPPPGYYSWG